MYEPNVTTQEEIARQRLAGWWAAMGVVEPEYPADTATVVRLVQAAEYACDHDTVLAYLNGGVIPPVPEGDNGGHAWNATHIVTLACALEMRRKWKPFSQLHAAKFTATEKLMHVCEHGGESAFTDLAQYDIDALLALLVQTAGNVGLVQTLVEALRHKMKLEGVL